MPLSLTACRRGSGSLLGYLHGRCTDEGGGPQDLVYIGRPTSQALGKYTPCRRLGGLLKETGFTKAYVPAVEDLLDLFLPWLLHQDKPSWALNPGPSSKSELAVFLCLIEESEAIYPLIYILRVSRFGWTNGVCVYWTTPGTSFLVLAQGHIFTPRHTPLVFWQIDCVICFDCALDGLYLFVHEKNGTNEQVLFDKFPVDTAESVIQVAAALSLYTWCCSGTDVNTTLAARRTTLRVDEAHQQDRDFSSSARKETRLSTGFVSCNAYYTLYCAFLKHGLLSGESPTMAYAICSRDAVKQFVAAVNHWRDPQQLAHCAPAHLDNNGSPGLERAQGFHGSSARHQMECRTMRGDNAKAALGHVPHVEPMQGELAVTWVGFATLPVMCCTQRTTGLDIRSTTAPSDLFYMTASALSVLDTDLFISGAGIVFSKFRKMITPNLPKKRLMAAGLLCLSTSRQDEGARGSEVGCNGSLRRELIDDILSPRERKPEDQKHVPHPQGLL
ncbi:hypothetical protein NM208_g8213 [Fusarium decemcellulare]|uniref:Uncharacterized protein n=1 Tax=Fusarium decemcellulare TaxID=57161 RepID=A0ACC1S653_9HYPO|nr:hypothetical protein NM208_g8213 [Fusarium decemcellulare]